MQRQPSKYLIPLAAAAATSASATWLKTPSEEEEEETLEPTLDQVEGDDDDVD